MDTAGENKMCTWFLVLMYTHVYFSGHATQPPHCTGQGISLLENLESYASKLVEPITYVYSVEPLNNAD